MAKKEKLDFDYNDFFDEKFEDTAVLMWNTHHQAFTFAFYLNQLYSLNLMRCDEKTLEGKDSPFDCSIYSYISTIDQQAFFLIDTTAAASNSKSSGIFFDKTMLIIGPDAFETAEHIYNETSQSSPTTTDNERNAMLQSFVDTGIFESALFDFSDPDRPETTYFPSSNISPSLQKKRDRFLQEQRKFVSDLIIAVDPFLPDFESE